jgi:hypothetical protein
MKFGTKINYKIYLHVLYRICFVDEELKALPNKKLWGYSRESITYTESAFKK